MPNKAQSFYYVRHPNENTLRSIWDRVIATAEAAALGTGTSMSYEIIHGNYSVLPNDTLAEVMHKNLSAVGGVHYSDADKAFAAELAKSLPDDSLITERAAQIKPYASGSRGNGSTDVGDVSWTVPTVGMSAATWVPGTGAHTWQAVAAGRTPIGHKGMIVAAKSMALTAVDLFKNPALLVRQEKNLICDGGQTSSMRRYWAIESRRSTTAANSPTPLSPPSRKECFKERLSAEARTRC